MARKRASMREGPLAELFKATEAAQRQQEPVAPGAPAEEPHESTVEHVPTWEDEVETPAPPRPDPTPEPSLPEPIPPPRPPDRIRPRADSPPAYSPETPVTVTQRRCRDGTASHTVRAGQRVRTSAKIRSSGGRRGTERVTGYDAGSPVESARSPDVPAEDSVRRRRTTLARADAGWLGREPTWEALRRRATPIRARGADLVLSPGEGEAPARVRRRPSRRCEEHRRLNAQARRRLLEGTKGAGGRDRRRRAASRGDTTIVIPNDGSAVMTVPRADASKSPTTCSARLRVGTDHAAGLIN